MYIYIIYMFIYIMAWFGHASQLCIEDDEFMMFMAYIFIYMSIYIMIPLQKWFNLLKKKVVGRPTWIFFGASFQEPDSADG